MGLGHGSRTDLARQGELLPLSYSIADEGRHMWLTFATVFGFTIEGNTKSSAGDSDRRSSNGIPLSFRCMDHLFYGQRCVNVGDTPSSDDNQPKTKKKWVGHRNRSSPWKSPMEN
jgi:hypothetical protein